MSLLERTCPRCKETTSKFHLMMNECDDCVNKFCKENQNIPEKYIEHKLGIMILNPEWVKYQENGKNNG